MVRIAFLEYTRRTPLLRGGWLTGYLRLKHRVSFPKFTGKDES